MTPEPTPARRYARIRYRLLLADLGGSLGLLAILQSSGVSHAVAHWWSHRVVSPSAALLGYLAVVGAVYYLAMLPLHVFSSLLLEHRFGLSRLTVKGWLIREAKRVSISAGLGIVLVEGLYALLRHAPHSWPIWATIGWVGFTVILARIFPTVVLPLFYKISPLQDPALVNRLLDLCRRTGLSALGVFQFQLGAETRKANAALAGLGASRRVLLSDTLLEAFTPEEIEGVLAHELAHHRRHHMTKLLILSAIGSWIVFTITDAVGPIWVESLGLAGLADIAGFPMLALWLSGLGVIGLPLQNGLSRYFEWQADRDAVRTTGFPQAFASALRRLARLNLADPEPPAWVAWIFSDHPPITQRIQAAEASHGI